MRLFHAGEQRACLVLELAILGRPIPADRRIQDFLELGAGFRLAPFVLEQLAQKEVGRRARWIVGQRLAEVSLGEFSIAAKQPRHAEIPSSERTIGRSFEEGGIETQNGLQLFLDWLAVLQALAKSERLRECAHVGGYPEVAFGPSGLDCDGLSAGIDPALQILAAFDIGSVSAEPVFGARELPGRLEITRVGGDGGAPEIGRTARARQVGAIRIQTIGLCARVAGGGDGRLSRKGRDIE